MEGGRELNKGRVREGAGGKGLEGGREGPGGREWPGWREGAGCR